MYLSFSHYLLQVIQQGQIPSMCCITFVAQGIWGVL